MIKEGIPNEAEIKVFVATAATHVDLRYIPFSYISDVRLSQ